jgi:hypothetical protein
VATYTQPEKTLMAGRTRTCWKCGEEIDAKGPAFEIKRFGRYDDPPERLLRLCENCWEPIELVLKQAEYVVRKTVMAGRKRVCWKCGGEIDTEGPAFGLQRFGRSYNPPTRLLRLCKECWQPIRVALEKVGCEIRDRHTVDLISHAREGAVAVQRSG